MQAIVVREFGGVDALSLETDWPVPALAPGHVLVRVEAAGVGPWDAWVRSGRSVLPQPLPLTPGSDIAGRVAALGEGVSGYAVGDAVFGVTNARFTGGYAEFALAEASRLAHLPVGLDAVAGAAMPVVSSTAWQMLFDIGQLQAGQHVLVSGGAGVVGSYAVQLARYAGATVSAYVRKQDAIHAAQLGAEQICIANTDDLADLGRAVDLLVDTIGDPVLKACMQTVRPGGRAVSAVGQPDVELASALGIESTFILVDVNTAALTRLGALAASGHIAPLVGDVLPLREARRAHEMLEGAPHRRGKIVLTV